MQNNPPPALLQRRNLAPLVLVNLGVGTHAIVWFMVVTAMPNVVDDRILELAKQQHYDY